MQFDPKNQKVNFQGMVRHLEEADMRKLRAKGITSFMDNNVYLENGRAITKLNLGLIYEKNLTEAELQAIKDIHVKRFYLLEQIKQQPSKILGTQMHDLEIGLQVAWKREPNPKEIKFWHLPGCTCPKQDNELIYPSDSPKIDPSCPLH